MRVFVFNIVENIMGKGENVGDQYFLSPSTAMFSKGSIFMVIESQDGVLNA